MKQADAQKYADLMEEIKRRVQVVDFFLVGAGHALFRPTTLESVGLQFRKILELIAFGSLVANKDAYSAVHSSFSKDWHAANLLKALAAANPDYYPRPVTETPSGAEGIKAKLVPREGDYLTKDEFVEVYGRLGSLMHASNPYGSPVDHPYYERQMPLWRTRIVNLLNCHEIRLLNDPGLYLIHMKEAQDEKVHWYRFRLKSRSEAPRARSERA